MQKIWVSDVDNCLLQINYDGNVLQNTEKKDTYTTGITVNREGSLLFTDDKELALFKVVDGVQIKLRETDEWVPRAVYSSRYTGDIFIGLTRKLENEEEAKLIRCSETGEKLLQEIQWNDGKPLYRWPHHIAESEVGDIYVSDYHLRSLVVVSKFGKFQTNMKVEDFWPHGVIVDRLGNVLVCNASFKTPCVLVFNQKGDLLTRILTRDDKIRNVRQICVDDEDRLYLLQKNASEIKVFQYVKRLKTD
jgi:sugar lactone lactonase YvrE